MCLSPKADCCIACESITLETHPSQPKPYRTTGQDGAAFQLNNTQHRPGRLSFPPQLPSLCMFGLINIRLHRQHHRMAFLRHISSFSSSSSSCSSFATKERTKRTRWPALYHISTVKHHVHVCCSNNNCFRPHALTPTLPFPFIATTATTSACLRWLTCSSTLRWVPRFAGKILHSQVQRGSRVWGRHPASRGTEDVAPYQSDEAYLICKDIWVNHEGVRCCRSAMVFKARLDQLNVNSFTFYQLVLNAKYDLIEWSSVEKLILFLLLDSFVNSEMGFWFGYCCVAASFTWMWHLFCIRCHDTAASSARFPLKRNQNETLKKKKKAHLECISVSSKKK